MKLLLACLSPIICLVLTSPLLPAHHPNTVRTDFDRPLGPEWVYLQEPDSSCYWLHDGRLRLIGSASDLKSNQQSTFVGRKQGSASFSFTTKIAFHDLDEGDEAGIAVYHTHEDFVQACLNNRGGDYHATLRLNLKNVNATLTTIPIGPVAQLWFRTKSDGKNYQFFFSFDGEFYHSLGEIDCSLLNLNTAFNEVGVTLGLYAYSGSDRLQAGPSMAEYEFVDYRELSQ